MIIKGHWLLKDVVSMLLVIDREPTTLYRVARASNISYSYCMISMKRYIEQGLIKRVKGKKLILTRKGKKVQDDILAIIEKTKNE